MSHPLRFNHSYSSHLTISKEQPSLLHTSMSSGGLGSRSSSTRARQLQANAVSAATQIRTQPTRTNTSAVNPELLLKGNKKRKLVCESVPRSSADRSMFSVKKTSHSSSSSVSGNRTNSEHGVGFHYSAETTPRHSFRHTSRDQQSRQSAAPFSSMGMSGRQFASRKVLASRPRHRLRTSNGASVSSPEANNRVTKDIVRRQRQQNNISDQVFSERKEQSSIAHVAAAEVSVPSGMQQHAQAPKLSTATLQSSNTERRSDAENDSSAIEEDDSTTDCELSASFLNTSSDDDSSCEEDTAKPKGKKKKMTRKGPNRMTRVDDEAVTMVADHIEDEGDFGDEEGVEYTDEDEDEDEDEEEDEDEDEDENDVEDEGEDHSEADLVTAQKIRNDVSRIQTAWDVKQREILVSRLQKNRGKMEARLSKYDTKYQPIHHPFIPVSVTSEKLPLSVEEDSTNKPRAFGAVQHKRVVLQVSRSGKVGGNVRAPIHDLATGEKSLPTARSYVTVGRNVRIQDDSRLRYLPYFGESDRSVIDLNLYSDGDEDSEVEDLKDDEVITKIVCKYGEDNPTTWVTLADVLDKDYSVEILKKRWKQLARTEVKKMNAQKNQLKSRGFDTFCAMNTFEKYYCRRCYTFNCTLHGLDQPRPRDNLLDSSRRIFPRSMFQTSPSTQISTQPTPSSSTLTSLPATSSSSARAPSSAFFSPRSSSSSSALTTASPTSSTLLSSSSSSPSSSSSLSSSSMPSSLSSSSNLFHLQLQKHKMMWMRKLNTKRAELLSATRVSETGDLRKRDITSLGAKNDRNLQSSDDAAMMDRDNSNVDPLRTETGNDRSGHAYEREKSADKDDEAEEVSGDDRTTSSSRVNLRRRAMKESGKEKEKEREKEKKGKKEKEKEAKENKDILLPPALEPKRACGDYCYFHFCCEAEKYGVAFDEESESYVLVNGCECNAKRHDRGCGGTTDDRTHCTDTERRMKERREGIDPFTMSHSAAASTPKTSKRLSLNVTSSFALSIPSTPSTDVQSRSTISKSTTGSKAKKRIFRRNHGQSTSDSRVVGVENDRKKMNDGARSNLTGYLSIYSPKKNKHIRRDASKSRGRKLDLRNHVIISKKKESTANNRSGRDTSIQSVSATAADMSNVTDVNASSTSVSPSRSWQWSDVKAVCEPLDHYSESVTTSDQHEAMHISQTSTQLNSDLSRSQDKLNASHIKETEFINESCRQSSINSSDTRSFASPSLSPSSSLPQSSSLSSSELSSAWSGLELMILEKSIFCVGMNYCRLATLVGTKTCAEVWRYVTKHSLKAPTHSSVDIEAWRYVEKKKKAKKKKRSSHIHRTQHQFERQQPRSFVPCDHDGECNPETCPCAGDMSYCEKFCACAASCLNRYTGCKCKGCKCRTRACPCYAAHRECDPDLCGSCEAHIPNELVDGAYNEEGKSGKKHRICQNIGLQTKKTKHILLGPSNVHGWGAFAKETTERNALLTEYLGEIISQEEADRRGKIYDKANCSYLFDLNEAYVIDAARKGNKIKFANHSEAPNCFSRIMFVNGDHRIGIYAKVKVKAGDELFFDYQHDHVGQTPEWFGQFKQAKTTHKKR